MTRQNKPLRIIETYAPDPVRCARALVRLLDWQPPPAPAGAAAAPGEDQRINSGPTEAPEEDRCTDHADHREQG